MEVVTAPGEPTTPTGSTGPATLSQRLAGHVHALDFPQLPSEVVAKAKHLITYNIVRALQGQSTDEADQGIRLADMLSGGPTGGTATVIGRPGRLHPLDAVLANCTMMRALQMDDVLFPVGVHAGLVTIPVALALAEHRGMSGRDLIVAVVGGYDAIGKLGAGTASWNVAAPRRPTIPFGPFGGAAAAGKLLRLDPARLTVAFGYAAHCAMGLAVDPWPHYYSLVARNGMMSAYLAQVGGQSSERILEARFGFYETFFGSVPADVGAAMDTLGTRFEILHSTTKRYPGTGANIIPIEFMRQAIRDGGLDAGSVERIDVFLPDERRNFSSSIWKGPFRDSTAAAGSLPFQLAMLLLDGGRTDFARYAQFDRPEILDLVDRVQITLEPEREEMRYARLEISCRDGRRYVREADDHMFPDVEGVPPLPRAGEGILPADKLDRAAELIGRLESVPDVGEVMTCLRPE